jgi:hypothetical protein
MESWWKSVKGKQLAQGDLLQECKFPIFTGKTGQEVEEYLASVSLLVLTQSCDLENGKVDFVSLCPIYTLEQYEELKPKFKKKNAWETVRKGHIAALHLLAAPTQPESNRDCLVVDFGQIISLPIEYLSNHAEGMENRFRLNSPYLEHFSQAFARFFMRVGLPSGIAPFS